MVWINLLYKWYLSHAYRNTENEFAFESGGNWHISSYLIIFTCITKQTFGINPAVTTVQRSTSHDDVIKWKHFPRYWPFVRGIHRSTVNSPHKGQWRGALMFSLMCARINSWVNNREAGDLRRYRRHYDVIVMLRKLHDLMPWTCFDNMTLTSLSTPCLVYYAAIRVSRDREPGPVINACLWCAVNLQCVSRELVSAPNKIWYYISRDCMLFVYFITISINMLLYIFPLLLRCIPEPVLFCEM